MNFATIGQNIVKLWYAVDSAAKKAVQICEEEPINENMITSEEKFNPTCEYENTNKEKARKDANNFLLES